MFDKFSGPDRTIVAAIDLEADNDNFLSSLQEWTARTGMSAHLVHVIQPWTTGYGNSFYPGEYTSVKIAEMTEVKRMRKAEEKLAAMANRFSPGTKVTTAVEVGPVVHTLLQEINLKTTTLVACNINRAPSKYAPNLFSTALSIMAGSTIPVMVFPDDVKTTLTDRHLKILVSDSLEDDCRAAVGASFEMALTLENTDIVHAHVHPKTKEELEDWANHVLELMTEQKIEMENSFSPKDVYERTTASISGKMSLRYGFEKQLLEAKSKGKYLQEIRFGEVFKELKNLVDQIDPDFVVFGRHHMIHTKPFAIGKVPYTGMLSLHKPTIMVPHVLSI